MYTKTTFIYIINLTLLELKLIWNPHLTYSTPSAILKFLHFCFGYHIIVKVSFAPLSCYGIINFCSCSKAFCSRMKTSAAALFLSWCFCFIFCACFHCGFNLTTFLSHIGQIASREVWYASGSHSCEVERVYGDHGNLTCSLVDKMTEFSFLIKSFSLNSSFWLELKGWFDLHHCVMQVSRICQM